MKLLLFTALFISIPAAFSHTDALALKSTTCYDIGNSSFCRSIKEDGQLSVIECYWKGDRRFCRIDNGDLKRVY
jgi:hypothetical protein